MTIQRLRVGPIRHFDPPIDSPADFKSADAVVVQVIAPARLEVEAPAVAWAHDARRAVDLLDVAGLERRPLMRAVRVNGIEGLSASFGDL